MSDVDAANGFTPLYHLHGGTVRYNGGYTIASALASDIFLGDPVIQTVTGQGTDIDVAAAAEVILGVFAGCSYIAANGDVVWAKQWVSGTVTLGSVAAEAFIYTDPSIVYNVQCNATVDSDEITEFMDIEYTSGNVANGVSLVELDVASALATILQVRVIRFASAPTGIELSTTASLFPRVECHIARTPEVVVFEA